MATLRSLVVSLTAKTEAFERGMKAAQKDLKDLRQVTQQSQSGLQAMGDSLIAAGRNAAVGLIGFQALKAGIENVVQTGLRMERLQVAFKAVAGSAEAGRKEFGFVSDTANRLGQNLETLARGYNSLSAASKGTKLEGQATKDIFLAITQAGRSLQLSQDQAHGALQAVQQMMSKGTVQAEELRGQLGERLPGAFQIAARAMGVTTAELGKMLEQGQVISEDFLPKFAAQLKRELGQTMEDTTRTAGENFARFGNAITLVADNLAKKTGLLDWLGKIAGGLATIVLEGDKAAKKLEEVANERARKAMEGTGIREDSVVARQLKNVEAGILVVEKRLQDLRKRSLSSDSEILKTQIREQEAQLSRLQKARDDLLAKKPAPTGMPLAGTGDIGADMAPFAATGDKNKAIAKQVKDILDEMNKAINATRDWETEAERLKRQMQEIEKTIEKIQKLPGMGISGKVSGNLGAPAHIKEAVERLAPQFGLDANLVTAIIKRESNFQVRAVSRAGAQGLMQLMPGTAKEMGVTDPFDVEQNLRGGMGYFRKMLDMPFVNQDIPLALAAYNAGPGAVQKHGGIPPFKETQEYVKAVTSMSSGAGTAAPEAVKALDELVKKRKELDQQIKTSIELTKAEDLAGKAAADAIEGRAEGMNRLIESLKDGTKALSEYEIAQIREKIATVQGFDGAKARIDTLLTEITVRRELVAMFKTEAAEQERLGAVQKQLADEQKQRDRDIATARRELDREDTERAKKQADKQKKIADEQKEIGATTISLFEEMIGAAKRGGDAWIEFGEKVAQALLKMAIESSGIEQQLGKIIQQGLGLVLKGLGLATGTPSVDLQAGEQIGGSIDFDNVLARAAGGPATKGRPYFVGESGRELFVPESSGTIVNNALTNAYTAGGNALTNAHSYGGSSTMVNSSVTQGDRPVSIVVNVQAQDAASFNNSRSRAEVQRGLVSAWQAAQRSA